MQPHAHSATPDAASTSAAGGPGPRRLWLRIALLALAIVAIVLLARRFAGAIPQFTAWVDGLGAWGAAAFVLGYVVATVSLVPASLLTLAAGAVFGIAKGIALVLVGATLGATAAFLVARYAARGAVERRLAGRPKVAAVVQAVSSEGRRIVFLLRLSPAVPFGVLNYALGVTRLRLADFLVAMIGIVPGTALYVYYGRVAGTVAAAAGGAGRQPAEWALLAAGLVATLVATWLITRAARRALADATTGQPATEHDDA